MIGGALTIMAVPLIIYMFRKPGWKPIEEIEIIGDMNILPTMRSLKRPNAKKFQVLKLSADDDRIDN
jgi:hypothetical protein